MKGAHWQLSVSVTGAMRYSVRAAKFSALAALTTVAAATAANLAMVALGGYAVLKTRNAERDREAARFVIDALSNPIY